MAEECGASSFKVEKFVKILVFFNSFLQYPEYFQMLKCRKRVSTFVHVRVRAACSPLALSWCGSLAVVIAFV